MNKMKGRKVGVVTKSGKQTIVLALLRFLETYLTSLRQLLNTIKFDILTILNLYRRVKQ